MLTLRKGDQRGHADHGWLDTHHSFSFADYHDPAHMGFRALRVINEDIVHGGEGFGMHGHRDMEILTWVLAGKLEHKDSMGNGSVFGPGELQYMSAGRGVMHSEFNASKADPVHLLQIWILPSLMGAPPRYGQKRFDAALEKGGFVTVASDDGRDGSIAIRQDARLIVAKLDGSQALEHALAPGRHAWLQVARGSLRLNGQQLEQGDGVAVSEERALKLTHGQRAEALLFDLA